MRKILITGATGHLGSIVIEHLLNKKNANEISILVRDENKASALKAKGVNVKVGSYQNKASMIEAFQGIDQLLLISSSDFNDRIGQHKNAIDAAKEAGVKHILYTGVTMHDINQSPLKTLLHDHFQTEDYIKENGFNYTFLQNGLYTDVIPMFTGEKVLETGIYFPAGEGKVAFASRQDLGEAIANILLSNNNVNKTYNLVGNEAHSFPDIAAELSKLSGKTVNYFSPEITDFENTLKQYGLPNEIISLSVLFGAGMKNNDFDKTDNTLETFLGRKPTSLSSFLKAAYKL